MDAQQASEERGLRGEGAKHAPAQPGALEAEHYRRHEIGQAVDSPVGGGVAREIACHQGLDQGRRLVESDGQPFAGDGVEVAGGIPHQGDATLGHGP